MNLQEALKQIKDLADKARWEASSRAEAIETDRDQIETTADETAYITLCGLLGSIEVLATNAAQYMTDHELDQ